jgi:hypothetical protein
VIVVAVSVDRPPQAVACRAVFVPFEGHKTPQRQALGRNSQLFTALFVYWLASVRLLEIITPIAVLPACLVGSCSSSGRRRREAADRRLDFCRDNCPVGRRAAGRVSLRRGASGRNLTACKPTPAGT